MNNPADSPISSKPQRLSFVTKLAYGLGDFGPALTANVYVFFLMYFLVNVAGMNPGLAGSVLLIGNVWDAVNDPAVGVLSDRIQTRWGRRLPWIVLGAIPFGLTFFLQWIVPFQDQWLLFVYYIVIALLSNTFYTIVNLPYTALTAELTQDYNERTSLNSFRFAFSLSGGIAALVLALTIFGLIKDPRQQYVLIGLLGGLLATTPIFLCVWGIYKPALAAEKHRKETADETIIPLVDQFKIAFSNRPFLFVIGIYLCAWLAFQNTAAILPFFVVNYMGLSEVISTQAAIAVQMTALLALSLWTYVSKRVGKQATYMMGTGIWLIGQVGLWVLQPGQTSWIYPLAILVGFGVSTAFLIPWSMLPDVVELDELNTGQRREGIFYGFMTLAQKICRGVGLFLIGLAMRQTGFRERVPGEPLPEQPPAALEAIHQVTALLPIALLLISLVLVYFYPITREVYAEILLRLHERKQEKRGGNEEVGR
ncbi:glycoside/pentoside/hexuronide transporter [Leptolyngbyaceae cyanobacterium JSC-12]|nr:glycoside/pentoside/hexuronide transporter [Leptolyngbyaceae cyanobacterium JSC-12]